MEELFKNMFRNPFEIFDVIKNFSENSDKIMENNIKFHKASISYSQAVIDMTQAINDNKKLMSK